MPPEILSGMPENQPWWRKHCYAEAFAERFRGVDGTTLRARFRPAAPPPHAGQLHYAVGLNPGSLAASTTALAIL